MRRSSSFGSQARASERKKNIFKLRKIEEILPLMTSGDLNFGLIITVTSRFLIIFDEFSNAACSVSLASPGIKLEHSPPPSLQQGVEIQKRSGTWVKCWSVRMSKWHVYYPESIQAICHALVTRQCKTMFILTLHYSLHCGSFIKIGQMFPEHRLIWQS